jgi:hypothetical protein
MISIAILYSSYREKIIMRHVFSWLFLFLAIQIFISAYKDAYKIIENKRNVKYEILVDGNILSNKNNHTFIGKSNDYIFFYNNSTNTSTIYPMDKVDKISIIKENEE